MKRVIPALAGLAALLLVGWPMAQTNPPQASQTSFIEHFTFDVAAPARYVPAGWDVTIVAHADGSIDPMWAEHGSMCGPPSNTWDRGIAPDPATNHFITRADQAVFACRDHIMTSMNAGYGAVYLTPPALLDFRNGPAVLEWDMSTQRTSSRDWVDIMILPFSPEDSALEPPMSLNMVDFHTPRDGLQVELIGGGNVFMPHTFTSGAVPGCSGGSFFRGPVYDCRFNFDGYHTWDMIQATYGLAPSAARRDHFRIEVSRTHLKVGFRTAPSAPYFNWVDADIPGGLRFSEGLVQLNQRAYNPLKACGPGVGDAGHPAEGWSPSGCRAATWHWDEVAMSPTTPITIMPGARSVSPGGSVTFPLPAPAGSYIKAAGSRGTEYSTNGVTWQRLPVVGPEGPVEHGDSFWAPVPTGTQTVSFRNGTLQDVYLYTRTPRDAIPLPTAPPVTPTGVPTSTPTTMPSTATPTTVATLIPPTTTPTTTSTPGSSPTPTVAPSPSPTGTATVVSASTATPTPSAALCEVRVRLDGTEGWIPKEGFCE